MTQQIEVPGIGPVDFPDDMTDDQIVAAIQGTTSKVPSGVSSEAYEFASKDVGSPRWEAALQGASFGFSDEAEAALQASYDKARALAQGKDYSFSDLYKSNRQAINQSLSQYSEENPAKSIGLTIGGGLLTGGVGGGKAAAMQAAKMKSLLPVAKHGAKLGLLSGAGFAPELEDVPASMAAGGALGFASPYALKGAMVAGKGLGKAGKSVLGSPAKLFQGSDDAARLTAGKGVTRAFGQDEINMADALKRMQGLGPEGVLADVGGVNVKKYLQSVASLPGKTADLAEKTLQGRMKKSVPRILSALKKSMGVKGTVYKTTKDLLGKRSAEAGPLYQKAFETGQVAPEKMGLLLESLDDVVISAKGTKLGGQLKAVQNALIQKSGEPKVSLKQLHWAKMDIDDRIGSAMRSGNKTLASELLKIKRGLLEAMDDVPEYAQARKIFSDDSAVIASIDRGKKILTENPEAMADFLPDMSKADLDGYLIGARETIANAIKKTPEGGNAARRVATYAVRERLAAAFPDEDSLNQFMKALDVEDTFAELRNSTIRGSATQPRVSTEALLAASAATDAAQGRFISVVMGKAAQWINNFKHIPEPVRDEVGKMLLTDLSKGSASRKTLEKLAKYHIKKAQVDELILSITAATSPGVTSGALSTQER